MSLMPEHYLVITSWPDLEGAKQVARDWVENNLAANVNILPEMHSIYRWKGECRSGSEHQILIKTSATKVEILEQAICDLHPYPVPEILRIAIDAGNPDYLRWITESTV